VIEVLASDDRVVATLRSSHDDHFHANGGRNPRPAVVFGGNGLPRGVPAPVVAVAHRSTTVQTRFATGIR
jgi:hypothetical protein